MVQQSRPVSTRRAGIALPATILVLVIVGALVTGGIFMAGQESTIAFSGDYSAEAFLAAERGLAEAIGGMRPSDYWTIGTDTVWTETDVSGGVETSSTIRIRPLDNDLFYVESTGQVTSGGRFSGAAHRTGTLVRPVSAQFDIDAALTSIGAVEVGGTGDVSGHDHTPTGDGFSCDALGESKPGIVSSGVSYTSGAGDVEGETPAIQQDTTLNPSTFLTFGNMTYDQLAGLANYSFDPGNNISPSPSYGADGSCDTSDPYNWGAQSGACSSYFPIIHIANSGGDIKLQDYGQGILLVDGDFKANGGGRFNGIVIVKGELDNGGGNGGVTGGVLVYNNGDVTAEYTINGNGVILYSRCAIEQAIEGSDALNRIVPIEQRSWVDLSATGAVTY